jgi:hypothetical protein
MVTAETSLKRPGPNEPISDGPSQKPISLRIGRRIAQLSGARGGCRSYRTAAEGAAVNKTLGIILIVLGLFGLAWGGFTYTTTEKVVDIGPIHATREKTHDVPLPPIAGAVALIGGVVLLVAGRKE